MVYLTSAYAGYNSIGAHASVYTVFFLISLFLSLPNNLIQILIRKKRIDILLTEYKRLFCAAMQFAGMFIGVLIIFTAIFEKKEMLFETGFWWGAVLSFFVLVLYYFFIGTVYIFFRLVITSNTKSFVCTFAVSILLLCIDKFMSVWTPVSKIDIFDFLFKNKLFIEDVILNGIKIIILITAIFYITYIMFKEKDMLHEKN